MRKLSWTGTWPIIESLRRLLIDVHLLTLGLPLCNNNLHYTVGDRAGLSRSDRTLRRTSSFANTLKSLVNGIAYPSLSDDGQMSPTILTHVHFQPEVADVSHLTLPNLADRKSVV